MSTIRLLIKPAIFTAGVCGTCFAGAAIIQHERHKFNPFQLSSVTWRRTTPSDPFGVPGWSLSKPQQSTIVATLVDWRRRMNAWKNSLTAGEKIALSTIFINLVVLGAWRLPAFKSVMNKYFISHSDPSRKIALSNMILSCFSHTMPLHFAVNMYALYSFSNISTMLLGPEQLVGMFLSAGAVSSFVSLAHRLATKRMIPSLGASGAVLGVVAYVCIKQPDSRLLLFFIPIAAGNAIKAIIALDTVGLLARWSFIDHAAHLGGSLFGVWYAMHGEQLFYKYRRTIVEKWLKLKKQTSD